MRRRLLVGKRSLLLAGLRYRSTIKVIRIQICEVGVGGFVIIIWNEWIIRLDVSVTHNANSAANTILDKKELFTVGKQVQILLGKF